MAGKTSPCSVLSNGPGPGFEWPCEDEDRDGHGLLAHCNDGEDGNHDYGDDDDGCCCPGPERENLTVTDRFGKTELDLHKPAELFVPSHVDPDIVPPAPNPDQHEVDHFQCYRIHLWSPKPGAPRWSQVTVDDAFHEAVTYDIKKPVRLCAAVDKAGEGIKNPAATLMCYAIKRAVKQKRTVQPRCHGADDGMHASDQFGTLTLDVGKSSRPSRPTPTGASLRSSAPKRPISSGSRSPTRREMRAR